MKHELYRRLTEHDDILPDEDSLMITSVKQKIFDRDSSKTSSHEQLPSVEIMKQVLAMTEVAKQISVTSEMEKEMSSTEQIKSEVTNNCKN